MANTKVPAELSSTPGIIDNSSATALTIDSAGAATFSGNVNGLNLAPSASGNRWGITAEVASNGVMEVGRYIDFHSTDADTSDYGARLDYDGSNLIIVSNTVTTGSGTFNGNIVGPSLQVTGNAIVATTNSFEAYVAASVVYTGAVNRSSGNYLDAINTAYSHKWYTGTTTTGGTTEKMRITSGGDVEVRGGASLKVYRDTNTAAAQLFMDAGEKLYIRNSYANKDLVFDRDGKLGIGTDNPASTFEIALGDIGNGANKGLRISNSGNSQAYSIRTGITTVNNHTLAVYDETAGANRLVISNTGNVGIGTTAPATALHVGGDITVGSAESVGTGAAAAIRFVNDNERSRITSNYASGGGGQMGFWTDSTGGTLVQRAYIKNNGEVNLQAGLRLNGYNYGNSDVFKTYYFDGPGSSTTTRTVNINTYFGFTNGTGGYFMMALHGWQTDSAAGLIHWHNAGSGGPMTSAYFEPFYTPTGLTVSVAKGTGDYDIDITLTGTHTNSHGWRMNVWG